MTRQQIQAELRSEMVRRGVHALVVPSTDPHQGEYVPDHYKARGFVSGFHGSAGTVVVTADKTGLWTDGRYFQEAAQALEGSDVELFRLQTPGTPDYPQWLLESLPAGSVVAVDPRLVTLEWHQRMTRTLSSRGISLAAMEDPFAAIWKDRPDVPENRVVVHNPDFVGEGVSARLTRLRRAIAETGAKAHFVSTLDDIAWILNLRGSDVDFNPVFVAYLLIERKRARLYSAITRFSPEALQQLGEAGVTVHPYRRALEDLTTLEGDQGPILLDPERTSWAVGQATANATVFQAVQPSTTMKACKHETELHHLREVMVRDGVVLARFLSWLDDLASDPRELEKHTELTLTRRLQELRSEDSRYVSESFDAISGLAGNGAIIHYRVTPETAATMSAPAVYLLDCGGQYQDGTTDITRTIALGDPTGDTLAAEHPRVREDFTRVLKGHIALAMLHFPEGASGRELDTVARLPLWEAQRNYAHGTGHGVGYFLNVHEGPQRIAPAGTDYPLEPGMVISNEPGLYRSGRYGIRIENLVAVTAPVGMDANEGEFGRFLSFETLSLCPIDRRLIHRDLLTPSEQQWVDRYHQRVRESLRKYLSPEEQGWLDAATAPLDPTDS